jgi:hypothetical protein
MPEQVALLPCDTHNQARQQAEGIDQAHSEAVANERDQSEQDDKPCDALPGCFERRIGLRGLAREANASLEELPTALRAKTLTAEGRQQTYDYHLFGLLVHGKTFLALQCRREEPPMALCFKNLGEHFITQKPPKSGLM